MFKQGSFAFLITAAFLAALMGGRGCQAASFVGSSVPTPHAASSAAPLALDSTCSTHGKNCFGMGAVINAAPNCDALAITCVKVLSDSARLQAPVPLTFGQPFKAGDLPQGYTLQARDNLGANIPLQMDDVSSHTDGSVRFAVLSASLPSLAAGELRVVNLYKAAQTISTVPAYNTAAFDLHLTAIVYSPQVSQITFGNRSGTTAGKPYLDGETITLLLQQGSAAAEQYTLTVTAAQAGGGFGTLTKIAETFMQRVNTSSTRFRAFKIGEGGGFEKLWITPIAADGEAFSVHFNYGGSAAQTVITQQAFVAPRSYVADARAALDKLLASNQKPRLNGPVAREYTVIAPFVDTASGTKHPQLTARLSARFYDGGKQVRTDMVVENNWTYEPNPGNLTYALTVTQGGQVVLQQPAFTHNHHARWHKVLWSSAAPAVQVRHYMPYFLASRATWNYDLALAVPESVLASEAANLATADTNPMGKAFITPYFPTTGGRSDIGPLPRWTALYLITQDTRALASMLANADAAAGIPIHYRDKATDQPVSLETHPGLAMVIDTSTVQDALPRMMNGATIWSPDTSHQASFAYIPYLLTGDVFYRDEVVFWANWNMGRINPSYREGAKGLINPEQVRGQAWALRSIGEAARALPDGHPMKQYFQTRLTNNLAWYVHKYSLSAIPSEVSPMGMIEKPDAKGINGPWQDDFMALVVGQLAESGEPLAAQYFRWLSRFTVGRFLNEAAGFCRTQAPGYYIKIRDANGAFITDWGALYKINWPKTASCVASAPIDGNPNGAGGYAAYARAMLGTSASLDIPGAAGAYSYWRTATPKIDAAFLSDPTWAIVPRND